ncbi:hypothetical protein ACIBU0_42395 [Streptomyces sp. NPDC049627]|uniref:hypothetical protein n=1 Tax=Streptomyces sp. NPDC049627 TaxID=3365595 RepID=UPI00379046E0
MRRRLWAARGREAYVPLKSSKRARRGRAPKGSGPGWIADVFEGGLEGLLDFLFSWGRR